MGEQKILFIAYNMKLQLIFLASTLALTFSKNIPVPELNKETEKNVKQLTNTALRKTQNFLKANGVEIKSLRQRLDNALNAGVPQLNAVKNEADKQYSKVADRSVGGLINFVSGEINKAIDGAENGVPDGAKSALDILQGFLGAVKDAGVDALGDNANKSIDDLVNAGSDALQNSANGVVVNNAIKNAKKQIKNSNNKN